MNESKYKEISCKKIKHLFNGELILLVTATDLETKFTHKKIKPLNGYDKILKLFEGDLTYYIGMLGIYKIAHVQSSMGSLSRSSSIMTVSTALDKIKSKVVIMVGVAFGVDEGKQNIGDVLVSESIIPYNSKRIGKDSTISRGIEAPASKLLLNRFKNATTTWEYIADDNVISKLIPTRLLSGEELVDNLEYRDKLTDLFPDSKGGEMEGAGVYAACSNKIDWIVVKGICDFADGNKGHDKSKRQEIAIEAALSLCENIFESIDIFRDLGINSMQIKDNIFSFDELQNIEGALFDIYDTNKEPYYVHRKEDEIFHSSLKQYGVWIHGITGCGKSNLIIRDLRYNNQYFIQICLASCLDHNNLTFFTEILLEIADKANYKIPILPQNFSECSKKILWVLKEYFSNKNLVIFIEEIPISTDEDYKDFSEKIFSLIMSKSLEFELSKIRFVLSSINNPIKYIQPYQQKVYSHLKFITLDAWKIDDIETLIGIIEIEFQYTLSKEIKNKLIDEANGSPRFIKKFFRNIYTIGKIDDETLNYILEETSNELNEYNNA